jgi:hypothetical protein
MLAAAVIKFRMTPRELLELPRRERTFMYAAMLWENEQRSS